MQSSEANNQSSSNNVDMGIDEGADAFNEPQPQPANPQLVPQVVNQAGSSDQDLDENLHAPQSLHHQEVHLMPQFKEPQPLKPLTSGGAETANQAQPAEGTEQCNFNSHM